MFNSDQDLYTAEILYKGDFDIEYISPDYSLLMKKVNEYFKNEPIERNIFDYKVKIYKKIQEF